MIVCSGFCFLHQVLDRTIRSAALPYPCGALAYFIITRGTFRTVTNNDLKFLRISVLGGRAPFV